ncbi:hypothetical protein LTR95_000608 [Oleoguttula sp. CCFEE 5521]
MRPASEIKNDGLILVDDSSLLRHEGLHIPRYLQATYHDTNPLHRKIGRVNGRFHTVLAKVLVQLPTNRNFTIETPSPYPRDTGGWAKDVTYYADSHPTLRNFTTRLDITIEKLFQFVRDDATLPKLANLRVRILLYHDKQRMEWMEKLLEKETKCLAGEQRSKLTVEWEFLPRGPGPHLARYWR